MSEVRSHLGSLPRTDMPVHDAVRRMRWFLAAFKAVVERVEGETAIVFELEETVLGQSFVAWLKRIDEATPHSEPARRAYFEHAAGLMLQELMRAKPLKVVRTPCGLDLERPENFWPEGFCYTIFCLNVYAAAMRQDYGIDAVRDTVLSDLRTWWSFRENAAENNAYCVAFFKLFAGSEPNWDMPDAFDWTKDGRPIAFGTAPGRVSR